MKFDLAPFFLVRFCLFLVAFSTFLLLFRIENEIHFKLALTKLAPRTSESRWKVLFLAVTIRRLETFCHDPGTDKDLQNWQNNRSLFWLASDEDSRVLNSRWQTKRIKFPSEKKTRSFATQQYQSFQNRIFLKDHNRPEIFPLKLFSESVTKIIIDEKWKIEFNFRNRNLITAMGHPLSNKLTKKFVQVIKVDKNWWKVEKLVQLSW